MPYAPGISYHGDQHLFNGLSRLGENLEKYVDEQKKQHNLGKAAQMFVDNADPKTLADLNINPDAFKNLGSKDKIQTLSAGQSVQAYKQGQEDRTRAIDSGLQVLASRKVQMELDKQKFAMLQQQQDIDANDFPTAAANLSRFQQPGGGNPEYDSEVSRIAEGGAGEFPQRPQQGMPPMAAFIAAQGQSPRVGLSENWQKMAVPLERLEANQNTNAAKLSESNAVTMRENERQKNRIALKELDDKLQRERQQIDIDARIEAREFGASVKDEQVYSSLAQDIKAKNDELREIYANYARNEQGQFTDPNIAEDVRKIRRVITDLEIDKREVRTRSKATTKPQPAAADVNYDSELKLATEALKTTSRDKVAKKFKERTGHDLP